MPDGVIASENGFAGMLAIGDDETAVGVAALERGKNPRETGRKVAKEAMEKNPDSKMWKKYNLSSANGKTVFEFKDTDAVAKQVFDEYIKNLGNGIVNLVNILFPEAIIIGGAISNQKDELIAPLKKYVDEHIYAKHINYKANIITAELTGDAGIIGGKFLFDKEI